MSNEQLCPSCAGRSDDGGVWVSHNYSPDGGSDVVFATEVEALRYALSYSQHVTFVPFGKSANEVPA